MHYLKKLAKEGTPDMTELYFNLRKYSEFFFAKNAIRKSHIQMTRNMPNTVSYTSTNFVKIYFAKTQRLLQHDKHFNKKESSRGQTDCVFRAPFSLAPNSSWMQLGEGLVGVTIQSDNLTDGAWQRSTVANSLNSFCVPVQ